MKTFNKTISKWSHLSFSHYQFSSYVYLKLKNSGLFQENVHLMKFQKVGAKKCEFSKVGF